MTTPERLRRRQRREEIMLIILGIVIGLVSFYFHHQDVTQRACITRNFGDSSRVLNLRGDLAKKDAQAQSMESEATRRLFADAFSAKDRAEFLAAYDKYQRRLAKVDELRAQTAQTRQRNPLPDFPAGTCD